LYEKLHEAPDVADRVRVVFYHGSTLSMTVVDWDDPATKLAFVTPKIQGLRGVRNKRLTFRATGGSFDVVTDQFQELVNLVDMGRDVDVVPLREAADHLQRLFDDMNE